MPLRDVIRNRNFFFILIDLLMMVILMLNLGLIIFDFIFSITVVNNYLYSHWPEFYSYYEHNIHVNFFEIDMIFIAVFLVEFFFSWTIAIVQKLYDKWFFYPIFHWYDLLGCIPLDAFRFVRILRVYSILVRLHKLGIINLKNTYVYRGYSKYYDVVVEEVSDRVVVNILDGIQGEVKSGGTVMEDILHNILRPKKDVIAEWISHRLKIGIEKNYSGHREQIKEYIDGLIEGAVEKSDDINAIELIPVMGKVISNAVKKTVSDVVYNVVDTTMSDLATTKNKLLVSELADFIFDSLEYEEKDAWLQEIFEDTLVQSLEVIKEQVKIKQWKLKEEKERMGKSEDADGSNPLKKDFVNQEGMEIVDRVGDM